MKKYNIFLLSIIILSCYSCDKDDKAESAKRLKEIVLHSIDYIENEEYDIITSFKYIYVNDNLVEITSDGKKHISFGRNNGQLVEKIYFNNLEQVFTIDSFFYNTEGQLMFIKTYNNLGWELKRSEIMYESGKPDKLKETVFYPRLDLMEFEFFYSGENVDKIVETNTNQVYNFSYLEKANIQNLNFFIEEFGLYITSPFGIGALTLPIIFSQNSIKSISIADGNGSSAFYTFEHFTEEGQYNVLNYMWYNQNQKLLNSSSIEFKY